MPPPDAALPEACPIAPETLLYLDGVSVSFDGFQALNSLSLIIDPGEMRAIIGPNGAGKTTMMDVVTGRARPDRGQVLFADRVDLTELSETEIANLGIGRKFQKPTVFESLTVLENLALALKADRRVLSALLSDIVPKRDERVERILETTRLAARRDRVAGALSHGQKQWLEIGMLLAQEPELMLLDEPVAGMTDAETEQTIDLLREIARERALVVVEHDMNFVRGLDCRVTVLDEGQVIAEGPMDAIQSDPHVIKVYLGR